MGAPLSYVRDGLKIELPDGRMLGYAEYGAPEGRPVLYFHGGISCRQDIAFAATACADRGVRIIAPDRPGIGISDRLPDRTLLDWADDVEVLLASLDLKGIPIMGWSLGSAYVFPCIYKMPGRFSKAATIGTCASFDSPEYVAELGLFIDRLLIRCPRSCKWVLQALLFLSGKMPPGMLKKEVENEVASSPPDLEVVRSLSDAQVTDFLYGSLEQGTDGVIEDYWAVREPWGFSVSDISVKTEMFHGDTDRMAPVSGAHRISEEMKEAQLTMIPESGHFLLHRKLNLVLDSLLA